MSRSGTTSNPVLASFAPPVLYGCAVFVGAFEAISIYGTLAGQRPTGAYAGLLVMLAVGIGASTLVADGAPRRRLIVKGAIIASVVALVGALLIPARIAEAQGAVVAGPHGVQTALFLLFQLGWAVTRWMTGDRIGPTRARHVPAAVGTGLLVVGGFVVGLGEDTPSVEGTVAADSVVFDRFSSAEDLASVTETPVVGDPGSVVFAHYHAGGQPLLGLSFSTKEWFGRERIADDLRGVFERGAEAEAAHLVMAPDGHIVVGIDVQVDDYVSALRVRFAPYDGTWISPYDRTSSDWYGGHDRRDPGVSIDGASKPIIGLRGSGGMVLSSVSLLTPR